MIKITHNMLREAIDRAVRRVYEERQQFSSARTSINGNKLPTGFANVGGMGGFRSGTHNFDMGGGRFDNATEHLSKSGVVNLVFDPFNREYAWNERMIKQVESIGGADTVTCFNVLNVIREPEQRAAVIQRCAEVLKPEGVAYFEVYSNPKKYAEVGPSQTGKDQWQEFRPAKTYIPEIQAFFDDVSIKGKTIIARSPKVAEKPANWYYDANDETPKQLKRRW